MTEQQLKHWQMMVKRSERLLTSECPQLEDEVIAAVESELQDLRDAIDDFKFHDLD